MAAVCLARGYVPADEQTGKDVRDGMARIGFGSIPVPIFRLSHRVAMQRRMFVRPRSRNRTRVIDKIVGLNEEYQKCRARGWTRSAVSLRLLCVPRG